MQSARQAAFRGRTPVLVAHRLSTVLDADPVARMERRGIVEEGFGAARLTRGALVPLTQTARGGETASRREALR